MTAIIRLSETLTSIEAFEFSATPGQCSKTGWMGDGHGAVTASRQEDEIHFVETGSFLLAGQSRPVAMRNVYRWRIGQHRITLSHERRGADAAVVLFDLVADGEYRLTSEAVHQCAADAYSARILLGDGGFDLHWRICGPRKDEYLHYRYHGRAARGGGRQSS
ncbi:DUF6314 family protein [Salinicola aestuarinus]|uniref:DUF6314 family protein n=1 Tax=Salinicola aestuarinus TaxID=1949082 RepID=UPI000DA1B65D|nr:DUF6314 family protein [Salinicola aestuarinus]